MATVVNSDLITRRYLYGSDNTPSSLTDRLRDLPADATTSIDVEINSYMNSYGIYAVPARSSFVKGFFEKTAITAPGSYTVADLITNGLAAQEDFHFSYQDAQIDIGNNSYMERAYIFGHEEFDISADTTFVVAADGSRSMSNVRVIPRRDNFDFESTGPAQTLDHYIIQPTVDPSTIGRKVWINYTGVLSARDYNNDNYIADVGKILGWDGSEFEAGIAVAAAIGPLLTTMNTHGVYENEENGKSIVYDGLGKNELTASDANSYILVGGAGNDQLTGGLGNDVLYGGTGQDTLLGGG